VASGVAQALRDIATTLIAMGFDPLLYRRAARNASA